MTPACRRHSRHGSTSLVALVTIATLTFIAGSFIVRVTNRSREAYHSTSWIEAGQVADSAASVALAEVRRVMVEGKDFPSDPWTGWAATQSGLAVALPTGRTIPTGVTLALRQPLTLTHAGEGTTVGTANVTVDAPTSLVDAAGQQWVRIRATGTTSVPGSARASLSAVDRRLRRLAFVREWSTGAVVTRPQVSRTVEWIAEPVSPFAAAIQAAGTVTATTGDTLVDSYDSTDTLKSTSGEYDSRKRQRNGSVFANATTFPMHGSILGDVGTNGGTLPADLSVSGDTDTGYYQALGGVAAPDWGVANYYSWPVYWAVNASTSTTGTPARYHFSTIAATVSLKANRTSNGTVIPSKVELWVDGDMTAGVVVEAGVQATIYVGGNVYLKSSDLVNANVQAANLQIYGLQPAAGVTRALEISMSGDVHAAIYAPGHDVLLSGSGDFMGALTGATVKLKGKRQVHFDEALKKQATLNVDYRLVSSVEDVR